MKTIQYEDSFNIKGRGKVITYNTKLSGQPVPNVHEIIRVDGQEYIVTGIERFRKMIYPNPPPSDEVGLVIKLLDTHILRIFEIVRDDMGLDDFKIKLEHLDPIEPGTRRIKLMGMRDGVRTGLAIKITIEHLVIQEEHLTDNLITAAEESWKAIQRHLDTRAEAEANE